MELVTFPLDTLADVRGMPTNEVPACATHAILFLQVPDGLGSLKTVHDGHHEIHEDNVEHFAFLQVLFDHLYSQLAVQRCLILDTDLLNLHLQTRLDEFVVLDDQYDLLAQLLVLVVQETFGASLQFL